MEAVDLKNGNLKSIYMVFSNVLLFILVCYAIYYVANIAYDMFFRKENVEIVPKVDEEEVDISDLAETFQPVSIVKDAPTVKWDDPIYDEEKDAEVEAMVDSALVSDQTTEEEDQEQVEEIEGLVTGTSYDDGVQEAESNDATDTSENTENVIDTESSEEELQSQNTESPDSQQQTDDEYHETMLMTGAIEINNLKPMIDEYAEDPENSQLKEIIGIWDK
jgi:hypothetical protein